MTLLAVERIKLFTTRSPWWGTLIALAIAIGFAALTTATADEGFVSVGSTQFGQFFALTVVMVLAALAITTEYRFGTIRTTFQAIPNRVSALLAKTTVVSSLALAIGLLAAFGALGISALIAPDANLALTSAADWRQVAGNGLVYALAAVLALAVGILLRHSAAAIAILLIYTAVIESLTPIIPEIGSTIHEWMPFNVVEKFLSGDGGTRAVAEAGPPLSTSTLSPWLALAYFAAIAFGMLAVALVVAHRRDA
ncbi:ABC transporter permease [Haloechinothrix sp. YIM 98757]|uniref:ABC transporter permease n=1 Tax=Haloechinothrix aidingensis TaxID=2752311 RepID=A0A838A7A3_9PSEU|nr:ABC transporter permease [Haloechinothrix aidingensis]MBA0123972.1 ABC transporter permease [Haloechinothrix aidingensis]